MHQQLTDSSSPTRRSPDDIARLLEVSRGSARELEYLLLLVRDLEPPEEEHYQHMYKCAAEMRRMLESQIKILRAES